MLKTLKEKSVKNQGITLVEVLITVFIMSIGILGTLLYFTTALRSTEMGREITVATSHGEFILAELYAKPDRDALINAIENTNWQTWGDNQFGASAGMPSQLPVETYTVTLADNTADPLDITTDISWTRNNRALTLTFNTQLTK